MMFQISFVGNQGPPRDISNLDTIYSSLKDLKCSLHIAQVFVSRKRIGHLHLLALKLK